MLEESYNIRFTYSPVVKYNGKYHYLMKKQYLLIFDPQTENYTIRKIIIT